MMWSARPTPAGSSEPQSARLEARPQSQSSCTVSAIRGNRVVTDSSGAGHPLRAIARSWDSCRGPAPALRIEERELWAGLRLGSAGRRRAATSPMSPNTASVAIAQAYAVVPVATTETRMVPAIAVPNDEPRLETLRDSPEISPCSSSGKLDWTTFTEGVSIAPTPRPMSSQAGNECPDAVGAPDEARAGARSRRW